MGTGRKGVWCVAWGMVVWMGVMVGVGGCGTGWGVGEFDADQFDEKCTMFTVEEFGYILDEYLAYAEAGYSRAAMLNAAALDCGMDGVIDDGACFSCMALIIDGVLWPN